MMMAKVDMFLESLINYDKENIHPDVIKAIQPYLKDSEFEPGKKISKYSQNILTFIFKMYYVINLVCSTFIRILHIPLPNHISKIVEQ